MNSTIPILYMFKVGHGNGSRHKEKDYNVIKPNLVDRLKPANVNMCPSEFGFDYIGYVD